ncbi:MAG: trypsin-like peptidase domain-containing protein [Myxococcales bacterium]|nr:trypsin-like peptidase domain-containing protein [Myxococcales bacterium]
MHANLLGPEDRSALVQALLDAGIFGAEYRRLLFADVPVSFWSRLPSMPDPQSQLRSDLNQLGKVRQLVDGSVPLRTWLAAVEGQLDDAAALATVRRVRAQVEGALNGQPPLQMTPPTEQPEAKVGGGDLLPVGFLSAALTAASAIARLRVAEHEAGAPRVHPQQGRVITHFGTGWLLTPTLLITCHHVIRARTLGDSAPADDDILAQVKAATISFGVTDDTTEGAPAMAVDLAATDPTLDYAILRLQDTGRQGIPLALDAIAPGQPVNILQHADGGPLRVALRNNLLAGVDDTTLRYYTDTLHGASGAPVCDDAWRARALHRSYAAADAVYQGRRVPYVNLGTRLDALLADLAKRAPAVHAEIIG